MDLATIIGAVATIAIIVGAILVGSPLQTFMDVPSILIVVFGSFSVTMIAYPMKQFLSAFKVAKNVLRYPHYEVAAQNQQIIQLANLARKEGILALERELGEITEPLLKKGMQYLVDGIDPEMVETMLYDELESMNSRHASGAQIFRSMAAVAPALGLIGTLIGLVQMLQNMSDPSSIGPAMAVALLTTFYGAMLANIVFNPMAGKLEARHQEELLAKESIIRGLLGIASGVNPRILVHHLDGSLPPKERSESAQAA